MGLTAHFYTYKATIKRVVDGDTVEAVVDLGFHIKMQMILRLLGVNTPEIVGASREDGLAAKKWLEEVIQDQEVIIETVKDRKDKYGRLLAVIWSEGESINDKLIAMGYSA